MKNKLMINNIEFTKFKEDEEKVYYVSTDILSKEIIDDIVEDKRYLNNNKDVIYNNDIFDNSWENSFIRKVLNNTFKEKYLNELNLADEVRCLTKNEVENLTNELKETSRYGYWTMSPDGYYGSRAYVFRVASDGNLWGNWVDYSYGVRPVITLNTNKI